MKEVQFLGRSLDDLRAFPAAARRAMSYQIDNLQHGFEADDWKPMTSVGPGVREIRVRVESGAWRTVYVASMPSAVYVLHCFQKKSQKTLNSDIDLARTRLNELMATKARKDK